ncbi:MAG: hypothetical protein JWN34_2199 [Bryobacterales bacterium]|nr:hypothetical protein [Bryobacterales bacterium]
MDRGDLIASQNPDGGWPFHGRLSCTEPTALAALALSATGSPQNSYERALTWLRARQRADGGWPPMDSVSRSTSVTSLVLMLPSGHLGPRLSERGAEWLLSLQGQETSPLYRLGQRLRGRTAPAEETHAGWPWYPGSAAWVTPTAMALLALSKHPGAAERCLDGEEFLRARMCADSGWNHGSARALNIEADSYPETTGIALLALPRSKSGQLQPSFRTALRHLGTCRSAEGNAWLRLGLHAHGVPVPGSPPVRCHDTRDIALQLLADAALDGRNIFA